MEQAVVVHLPVAEDPFGSARERELVASLTKALDHAVNEHGVGELDGEEFGAGRCVIYMYGPDADRLFATIAPILKAAPETRGGFVIKRYGEAEDAAAAEIRVDL